MFLFLLNGFKKKFLHKIITNAMKFGYFMRMLNMDNSIVSVEVIHLNEIKSISLSLYIERQVIKFFS